MGEMTIRLDEALAVKMADVARQRGIEPSQLVVELVERGLQGPPVDRWPVAREIRSRGVRSPISSVDLLAEIRNEDS